MTKDTAGPTIQAVEVVARMKAFSRLRSIWCCSAKPLPRLDIVDTALVLIPIYLPYARVAREQHMVRSLDIVKDYSAPPKGYLAAAGRIHLATWSARFTTSHASAETGKRGS